MKNTSGHAAIAAAVLATAIQLSTGTAGAASPVRLWVGGGTDALACQATGLSCKLYGYVPDLTTPVTISVDGTAIITAMPTATVGNNAPGELSTMWTPKTAGHHVITVQQGSLNASATLGIIDNSSVEALSRRISYGLSSFSSSMSAGHDPNVR